MSFVRLTLGLLALLLADTSAAQTSYPEKPVRLIVSRPPGSQPDIVGRLVGQKFSEAWGKPVVIENIAGAAGNIAMERTVKATPDGYTIAFLNEAQILISPSLYKLGYDPVKELVPISLGYVFSYAFTIHPSVPAQSVREFVALAKAQPGAFTFASGGSGSVTHLAVELFKSMQGIDIRHIPYKGVSAALPDLLGGRVTMSFGNFAVAAPAVREGKLRGLAVTSAKRSPVLPDLPTLDEAGVRGFEATSWGGLFAPAKTPPAIVRKLHLDIANALAQPDLRAKLADLSLDGGGNSPEEFAALIKSGVPKWSKLVRELGIKAE